MKFKILYFVLLLSTVRGLPIETAPVNNDNYLSPHIIGGKDAPDGYAPHMAALVVGESVTIVNCGGSIVLPNLILTAAHCIEAFVGPNGLLITFHAVVGSNNWRRGGTAVKFKDYHIHPEWDPKTIKNDVGFLVLQEKVALSETVKIVALNFDRVEGNEPSYVTGWGFIAHAAWNPFYLQILEVNTLTPQHCADKINAANAISWNSKAYVDPAIEICSFNSFGTGLCHGDSGSALISRKSGTQIGIASWVLTCARGAPDIHVRISGFKEYIQRIMRKYH